MKTIEDIKNLMVGKSVITDLADLLRANDAEFAESEKKYLAAVEILRTELPSELTPTLDEFLGACETDVISAVAYAGYLGFRVNLENFHHPIGIDFVRLDTMMTILASYAQEESRSASENQKWRIRANFQNGLPWNGLVLGYRIEDGIYVPVEEEAALVKLIFSLYNSGWGTYKIAKHLNKEGYRTRLGNLWTQGSLQRLLNNYAYTGNLLLQTTFVEDHITKKGRINRGQLPMYHAEDSHEAIISMTEFQITQETRKGRASVYAHTSDPNVNYPFRGKLVCMDCGKNYRRKMVSRGPAWVCGTYNSKGKEFCPTSKVIPEDTLMAVTAEILETDTFDEAAFLAKVERIEIGTENRLTYCFKDGSKAVTAWQDRSRRESWTREKREAARKTALQHETPERNSDGRFKKKDTVCLLPSGDQSPTQHDQRRPQL